MTETMIPPLLVLFRTGFAGVLLIIDEIDRRGERKWVYIFGTINIEGLLNLCCF